MSTPALSDKQLEDVKAAFARGAKGGQRIDAAAAVDALFSLGLDSPKVRSGRGEGGQRQRDGERGRCVREKGRRASRQRKNEKESDAVTGTHTHTHTHTHTQRKKTEV